MDFNIGDKVEVIDEALSGVICAIKGDQITFCCEDGFEYTYALSQVLIYDQQGKVKHQIHGDFKLEEEFQPSQVDLINREESYLMSPQFSISFKGKKPVFDLHLEELAPQYTFELKHDALNFQLNFVRRVIEKATQSRQRKLIFIHGVGTGALREALRTMLREEYPHIEYFDGNYFSYGQGATEIIIHGLGKADLKG